MIRVFIVAALMYWPTPQHKHSKCVVVMRLGSGLARSVDLTAKPVLHPKHQRRHAEIPT